MNKSFLFPHWCQKTGWWMLAALAVVGVLVLILASTDPEWVIECPDWVEYPLLLIAFFPSLALLLICLSQENQEDEYVAHIRARSVFIVVIVAFVVSLFNYPIMNIGPRFFPLETMGLYKSVYFNLTNPFIFSLIYLIIFKGIMFVNWLKTRNDDGQ